MSAGLDQKGPVGTTSQARQWEPEPHWQGIALMIPSGGLGETALPSLTGSPRFTFGTGIVLVSNRVHPEINGHFSKAGYPQPEASLGAALSG